MAAEAAVAAAKKAGGKDCKDSNVDEGKNDSFTVSVGCKNFIGQSVYLVQLKEIEDAMCKVKSVKQVESLE